MQNVLSVAAPSSDDDFAWRTRNIGYLLTAATDRCVRDKLRVVQELEFSDVSEAQLALFHNLDAGGDRLTTIAARAGLTKQSMIELVDKAEALALVERLPASDDKRAKIIGFTPRGHGLLAALHQAVSEAERRMVQIIGSSFLETLRSKLGLYGLSVSDIADGTNSHQDDLSWRTSNIGHMLSWAAKRFVKDVLADVHARGNRDVSEVMLPLLRNLALDGSRLTELAVHARVTKQSMREMVDRVERLGLIERRPDPTDRRAKCIMLTDRGLDLLFEMRRGVEHAESKFIETTGARFTNDMKVRLAVYAHHQPIDGYDPTVSSSSRPRSSAANVSGSAA